MDGVGGGAFVCHDASDPGSRLFPAGHADRAVKENAGRRSTQPSCGTCEVVLEALPVEAKRPASLRKDVLGGFLNVKGTGPISILAIDEAQQKVLVVASDNRAGADGSAACGDSGFRSRTIHLLSVLNCRDKHSGHISLLSRFGGVPG